MCERWCVRTITPSHRYSVPGGHLIQRPAYRKYGLHSNHHMNWWGHWSAASLNNVRRHYLRNIWWEEPRLMLNRRGGSSSSSCGRSGYAGEHSMTATGTSRHIGSTRTTGLGWCVANRSDPASWDPNPSQILRESCCKERIIDIRRQQCRDGIQWWHSVYPVSIL